MSRLNGRPAAPRSATSRRARSCRSVARTSRSATTASSARRRWRSVPPGRSRSPSRSRSRCARPVTRRNSPSASCGRKGLIDGRRDRLDLGRRPGIAEPAGRHDPRPPHPAVRRLEGRRAPLHRDGLVRHLRQGLDRRGRAALRPAPGRAGRAPDRDPRPARPAARRPACLRRDGRPARRRSVHAEWRADRPSRGRRTAQRARQGHRVAGPREGAAAPRPGPDGVGAGQLRDHPEGRRGRDPDRVRRVGARPISPSTRPSASA